MDLILQITAINWNASTDGPLSVPKVSNNKLCAVLCTMMCRSVVHAQTSYFELR